MAWESDAERVARHIAKIAPGLEYGKTVRIGAPGKPSTNQVATGAIPEKCVFILPTRGLTAERWGGGGGINKPSLQIWCRGSKGNFNEAYELASNVWQALEVQPPAGYFDSRALYSGPEYLQQDEMGCHEFVINVDLRMQV